MTQPTPLVAGAANDLAVIGLSSRIPQFWADMPKLWFLQFEAVMGPQHQADTVKYDMVLSKLGKEELSQVGDIIGNPPEQQRYVALKNRLLKVFQASAEEQFHKLVSEMDLGQQRPSQLLTKMNELARNSGAAGDTVKNLWLSRLPPWVRAILAANKADTKLDDLAEMADKIMNNLRSGEITAVDTGAASTPAAAEVNSELVTQLRDMKLELKNLRQEINSIGDRRQQYQRSRRPWRRDRSRSHSRSSTPRRTPRSPDWLCRYHFRFREAARRCESPCIWKTSESEN
ncbi:uncharacterized protein LOC123879793 [Maniola jurtina]|uniref:uncharacterized protein LOC123879793 n=1 Tax=Maniola jurtina TaxID=191418 RepID=UPI001E68C114|nr:uncharacterized protein LOC123879793 [Maniola jurtina]